MKIRVKFVSVDREFAIQAAVIKGAASGAAVLVAKNTVEEFRLIAAKMGLEAVEVTSVPEKDLKS